MNKAASEFQDFRQRKRAAVALGRLSDFDDDGTFLVEVLGTPPLKQVVRAPSAIVLEHAARRQGLLVRVTRV